MIKGIIYDYAKMKIKKEVNIAKLAREYKKSRTTIYTYLKKFSVEVLSIMKDLLLDLTAPLLIDNLNIKFLNTYLDSRYKTNNKPPFLFNPPPELIKERSDLEKIAA